MVLMKKIAQVKISYKIDYTWTQNWIHLRQKTKQMGSNRLQNWLLLRKKGRKIMMVEKGIDWLSSDFCFPAPHIYFSSQARCDRLTQFTCNSGRCIDIREKCDGTPNCDDGTDEDDSLCSESSSDGGGNGGSGDKNNGKSCLINDFLAANQQLVLLVMQ